MFGEDDLPQEKQHGAIFLVPLLFLLGLLIVPRKVLSSRDSGRNQTVYLFEIVRHISSEYHVLFENSQQEWT